MVMTLPNTPEDIQTQTIDNWPTKQRLVPAPIIRFSEISAAFSVALDITQGHPRGHCMRSCIIGMRLASDLQLSKSDRSALFYGLLFKDLGCSSNAAKMAHLFGADDHQLKHSFRMIDITNGFETLKHCWKNCAVEKSTVKRFLKMGGILRSGQQGAIKLASTRCERGAEISRDLQLPEATATAILDLDEHWNGGGTPLGRKGDEISLLGRICCLAQTMEVFNQEHGWSLACDMARTRRGRWFDPELVDRLLRAEYIPDLLMQLASSNLVAEISCWEPEDAILLADDHSIDRVAHAFASVVDAKSPWTFQHSTCVADIAAGICGEFGCSPGLTQDIRRAALLHDLGKLAISNLILDKPSKPTDEEFAQIRRHPAYSQQILRQIPAFRQLSEVAGAHHERLDGRGYHRGLAGDQISFATRILTVADCTEAMTAMRPYREALKWEQVQQILEKDAGKAFDPECVQAVLNWHDKHEVPSRVESQLAAIETVFA